MNDLEEKYKALETAYISLKNLYDAQNNTYQLNRKQYLFLWGKIKPYMNGKPDMEQVYHTLGKILEKISDSDQRQAVTRNIIPLLQIMQSAVDENTEL